MLAMTFALIAPSFGQTKELSKKEVKQIEKMAKQKEKELVKEGWKLDGSTLTLNYKLIEHYTKLKDPNCREIVGSASECASRNVGQQWTLNNAMTKYAQEAKSYVMGKVLSEIGNIANEELDSFYGAYERLISAEISGDLETSFSLVKPSKDGKYEYDTYYIINENLASKKRIAAYENALKESEAARKYAEQISKFVRADIRK